MMWAAKPYWCGINWWKGVTEMCMLSLCIAIRFTVQAPTLPWVAGGVNGQ